MSCAFSSAGGGCTGTEGSLAGTVGRVGCMSADVRGPPPQAPPGGDVSTLSLQDRRGRWEGQIVELSRWRMYLRKHSLPDVRTTTWLRRKRFLVREVRCPRGCRSPNRQGRKGGFLADASSSSEPLLSDGSEDLERSAVRAVGAVKRQRAGQAVPGGIGQHDYKQRLGTGGHRIVHKIEANRIATLITACRPGAYTAQSIETVIDIGGEDRRCVSETG